jgi:hypothetical protein
MNIEQANCIPITEILDKINYKPSRISPYDAYYLAPWRNEKTASLHVNIKTNKWFDHGDPGCKGGDAVSLVQKWLQFSGVGYTVSDALRWIKNMCEYAPVIAPVKSFDPPKPQPKLRVTDVREIKHPALIEYLDSRGIPLPIGQEYYKEVTVYNRESQKSIFALGMRNEIGGWEICNKYYKASVGPKYPTIIRGTKPKPEGFHVFEGGTDFVSSVIQQNNGRRFEHDSYILHSVVNLPKLTPFVKGYGYTLGQSWMDNDQPGIEATASLDEFFKTEENLTHKPMNAIYAPYKDVNAWHMVKLGLTG